jgi:inner membrane protein
MPSVLGHVAPVLALIPVFSGPTMPRRLWLLGPLCAVAPDLDVVAFAFGVPYEHPLGHRGLWHSVPFAACFAAAVALALPRGAPSFPRRRAWAYLFLATASHGVLDAFTNGGLGVALLAPFDFTRYFAPLRPIQVSPLDAGAFLSAKGLRVLRSELLWLLLPSAAFGLSAALLRRARRPSPR